MDPSGAIGRDRLWLLVDYLADMAHRDRREVVSRLNVLLVHIIQWIDQPERRSRSWLATVVEQRQELHSLLGRGILHQHAATILPNAYRKAVERTVVETGRNTALFPDNGPYSLQDLLESDQIVDDHQN